jgi:hypothetical protein
MITKKESKRVKISIDKKPRESNEVNKKVVEARTLRSKK